MKLVILTQYFPPEVGAPQNRLYELAVRLKNKGIDITVVTAMPNYPAMEIQSDYKKKYFVKEDMNGLKIIRSYIYVSKSKSIVKRLLNYYSFVISSFIASCFYVKEHDYIICESPPLFLGKTGWLVSLIHRSKFILNVSDLWPESAEKLGLVSNKSVLKISTVLEEFLYKRSSFITGQTQGIVNNIKGRFPDKDVYWLPNGVDVKLFHPNRNSEWKLANGFHESDFVFLYAGIIGHAQGLEIILEAAKRIKNKSEIKFVLLGAGPEKSKLMQMKEEYNLNNVFFFDAISKQEMIQVLNSVDATIIPLRKLDLFLGAIPSKIFENLAMRVPVLLGVDGEARELFVSKGNCALYFEPENVDELVNRVEEIYGQPKLRQLLTENGVKYVSENFERNKIADKFYLKLLEYRN